jgi:hypothetical protein
LSAVGRGVAVARKKREKVTAFAEPIDAAIDKANSGPALAELTDHCDRGWPREGRSPFLLMKNGAGSRLTAERERCRRRSVSIATPSSAARRTDCGDETG